VGPSAAHSGSNLLGTNLGGDYLTGTALYGDEGDSDWQRDPIFQPSLNFYTEDTPDIVTVDFWHWYDTIGDTCPDCTAARGTVRRNGISGPWNMFYPVGDYPGPMLCSYEYWDQWGYSGVGEGRWEPATIWDDELVHQGGDSLNLAFSFVTTTYGEADGAGWYIDDVSVSMLFTDWWDDRYVGYSEIKFATGPAAYTLSWEYMSGYPILDEPDGGIEDCNEIGVNAIVGTCVYDKYGNPIREAGVAVDYSFEDDYTNPNRTDNTARFVETIIGTLNSGAGSTVAEAETSEEGLIMIAISDTESETILVESSADGLTDTDSTEVNFSEQGSFPAGDCCDNPIDLGVDTYFWDYRSFCNFHPLGQMLECGSPDQRDVVFTFQPAQDDLYDIYVYGYGYSIVAELRELGTAGCPGIPIPNEGDPEQGNCMDNGMFAYLYKDKTYVLVVQQDYVGQDNCYDFYVDIGQATSGS
jgi:hypothetical protein